MIKNILLAIIPIFVAVDPLGVLPIYISLTSEMDRSTRRTVILQSAVTAAALSIGFVFVGRGVFRLLGITVADFMIAGGAILFYLAIIDLVQGDKERRTPGNELGIVPLGTPLIAGPAVLSTSLLIVDEFGIIPTLLSLIVNISITALAFSASRIIIRALGAPGIKAVSKITSLLLASIAVMMVRKGILELFFTSRA